MSNKSYSFKENSYVIVNQGGEKKVMKKILSVALSTAMAFSMFATVAFGADAKLTPEQQFNALKDAGIVEGFPDGLSHLDRSLTRAELAKIITKATDLTPVDATSYTDKNYAKHWARTYIEAVTQAGIMEGKNLEKKLFDPSGNLSVQELAAVLVRALKLEVPTDANNTATEWAKGYVEAAVKGGYIDAGINYQANASRSQAIVAAYAIYQDSQLKVAKAEAIDATHVKLTLSTGEVVDVTLEKALEANKATELEYTTKDGKVLKYTVTYVMTAAQKVVSASASNYKELVVKFDGELDSATAENEANYKVSGVNFESATLSKDKTEVTLLVANDATKLPVQKESTLEFKGIKNADASKTLDGSVKFTAVDTTLPAVQSATALGTKAIKVVFSEPVTSASASNLANYKIDGNAISGYVTFTYPNIAFITTNVSVGEHTLSVQNVTDFNNFKVAAVDTKINVAEDTTAPEIVSIKANDLKKVEVEFNEPVKSVSKAYHTSSSRTPEKIDIKDNKVTLTFDDTNRLSLGESTVYLNGVTDYSDNSADRNATVTPVLDTTRPVVNAVSAESKDSYTEITVDFSKNVNKADMQKTENYVLRNEKGEIFTGKGFTTKGNPVSTPKYAVVKGKDVESKAVIQSLAVLPAGKYSLEISGIRDQASIGNTLVPQKVDFTVNETGAVKASAAWYTTDGEDTLVYVQFNKAVAVTDAGSALELNKYDLKKTDGSYLPFPAKSAKVAPYSANTVVITVPTADLPANIAAVSALRINNVADLNGNYIAVGTEVTLNDRAQSTVGINGEEVKATSRTTVTVETYGELTYVDANDFVFTGITGNYRITDSKPSNGNTVITFTFDEKLNHDTSGIKLSTIQVPKSEDSYGRKLAATTTPISVADGIAPEVQVGAKTFAKDNKVEIQFTEKVTPWFTPGAFVVKVNGDSVDVKNVGTNGNDVIVLTLDKTLTAGNVVEVYVDPAGKNVVDGAGNAAEVNLKLTAQ